MSETKEEQLDKLAKEIDQATAELGPIVRRLAQTGVSNQAMAVSLVSMAAHHALHDGASLDDLIAVARNAWDGAVAVHARECVK